MLVESVCDALYKLTEVSALKKSAHTSHSDLRYIVKSVQNSPNPSRMTETGPVKSGMVYLDILYFTSKIYTPVLDLRSS